MKALVRIPILFAALVALVALPASTRAAIPAAARHDVLMLRTGNSVYGAFTAVTVVGGRISSPLPLGLFDHSGRILYAAIPQGGTSVVQAIDAASGRVLHTLTLAGNFSTAGGDYVPGALTSAQGASHGVTPRGMAPRAILQRRISAGGFPVDASQTLSALSFNGRWLALRDATPGARTTYAVVIDTTTMRVVATLRLPGIFALDAISSDGASLYLLEQLAHAGPQAYQVRVYEVRRGRLVDDPLRENGEASTTIRGVAYTRLWSARGDWLFTLYVQPGRSGAFIHALGVAYRRVHCIVLHDGRAAAADLAHYALAVSHDGSTLYAVNPVLGRAAAVRGGLPYGRRDLVTLGMRAASPRGAETGAVLSRDGRTLFVATNRGVWAMAARTLTIRATYLVGQRVSSLALSRDGRRLYALEPSEGSIAALDAASGRVLGSLHTDGTAWAIARVMS